MTDTQEAKAMPGRGLTPGHWIGIARISVIVLGGVLSWGLSQQNARFGENNTRLANIESTTTNMVEGLARVESSNKTINERLNGFEQRVDERFNRVDERFNRLEMNIDDPPDRIEINIGRLIQLHLQAGTAQPAASGRLGSERRRQHAGTRA